MAGHNEISDVIPLPNALGVNPGVVEEEASIDPIANDQSALPLYNWDSDLEDESSYYYPSVQEVDGGSEYFPLPQSNIDYVE